MPFLQLTLTIGAADPEPFEAAVLAAGASSITLEDAGDDPVLERDSGGIFAPNGIPPKGCPAFLWAAAKCESRRSQRQEVN